MYSNDDIRGYIQANNLGSNPFGIAAAQQQFGVSNDQLDNAMGWGAGAAQNWWDQQNQQVQQTQNNAQTMQQSGQPGYGVGAMTPQQQNMQQPMQQPQLSNGGMGSTAFNGGAGGGNPYAAPQGNPYMGTMQTQPTPSQPGQQSPFGSGPGQMGPGLPSPQMSNQPGQVGQQQAGINPYLGTMAQSIAAQSNDSLQRNVLPAIRGGAIMNGGLGGSRQGVVEANAINDQQRNLISSLSGLYGNAFESQQGRDLQRYGMDQSAALQRSGQDLQRYGMDQNFYSTQRGLDFQGQRLGADLFQQGMDGLANQGRGLYQTGMQEQAAGFLPFQQFANLLGPFTGLNQTNTNSTDTSGNVIGGALAGGLTLAQLYRLFSGQP